MELTSVQHSSKAWPFLSLLQDYSFSSLRFFFFNSNKTVLELSFESILRLFCLWNKELQEGTPTSVLIATVSLHPGKSIGWNPSHSQKQSLACLFCVDGAPWMKKKINKDRATVGMVKEIWRRKQPGASESVQTNRGYGGRSERNQEKRKLTKRVHVNLENLRQKDFVSKILRLYREEQLGEGKQKPKSGVGVVELNG